VEVTELRKSEETGTICRFCSGGVGREDGLEGKGGEFIREGVAYLVLESPGVGGRPAAEPVRCGDVRTEGVSIDASTGLRFTGKDDSS
jgi:hypothetical protein